MNDNPLRRLPAIGKLLDQPDLRDAAVRYSRAAVSAAVRAEVDDVRAGLSSGGLAAPPQDLEIVANALARLEAGAAATLRPVINATGVVLHTNLGRSPLHESAALAAYEAGRNYTNLELDLATGKRGSRQAAVRAGLRALTGAESATVVNNCAAATVVALKAVAAGREVIVSRGQLIEIGGGFRIPEVMATSGAVLREVGTTNITRLADYERAIGPSTAALMRVHTSNYRVRGFTKAVPLADLVSLGRKHGLAVIDDAGSGQAVDLTPFGLPGEPIVSAGIAAGADLVLFSGDKLLGGPQAGIIAGSATWVQRIEKGPLMRAVRLDKMTLAALDATLRLYRDPETARREAPALRMLTTPLKVLKARSAAFADRLRQAPGAASVAVLEDRAFAGGGSLPDIALPTVVIAVAARDRGEADVAARLRTGATPVVGRVREGRLWLDLRTVFERQEPDLLAAVAAAVGP